MLFKYGAGQFVKHCPFSSNVCYGHLWNLSSIEYSATKYLSLSKKRTFPQYSLNYIKTPCGEEQEKPAVRGTKVIPGITAYLV